ncbi:MAG: tetratricopeptide repeat protein [Chthoniobacteraceae bacterium]
MRILARSIFILGLLLLTTVLYREAQALRNAEFVDGTRVMILFLGIVFIAIIIGATVAITIVPAIGESVGSFFFSPNEQIEKDAHADAMAKIAQGDYEGAIEEYRAALEKNPEDTHAISEIVHLYCDKLDDPNSAEEILTEALEGEWPPEQSAFLCSRLVDVYWNHEGDGESATHILHQIIETMPDTKYAANATHRLHEIERAVASGQAPLPISDESKPELQTPEA